jgi:hypothetical protein
VPKSRANDKNFMDDSSVDVEILPAFKKDAGGALS